MYLIDTQRIEKGDIFLTTQSSILSKGIRVFTESAFSHAMLYMGDQSFIHSDGKGVHSGNVQRLIFSRQEQAAVLRVKRNVDRSLIDQACGFARAQIGKQYSTRDAIATKFRVAQRTDSNRQFCSRLVAQSFDCVGLKLVENPRYCAPSELDDSELTIRISNCIREACAEDIEVALRKNLPERQQEVTNCFFEKVRKITQQDIQTFEQLLAHLRKDATHDNAVSEALDDSGYCNLWIEETLENPWRTDKNLFLSLRLLPKAISELADIELKNAANQKALFVENYEMYQETRQKNNLQYALKMTMLYFQLINWCDIRMSVCKLVKNQLK